MNPKSHETWYNKGIALDELKRYDEALECYEKSLNKPKRSQNME
ncbi:hypothetical protein DNK57_02010 [Methanothermobacter thermautotrophicus]|uniref:Tetratricopeptide repeat protein n=1 Tax=Methanothermobacter thermautotrophicus TaxID=145262 RepID=A0A842YPG3_METTF|nr:hypothetical protein [Methanothermobacter thermautotrophicus]